MSISLSNMYLTNSSGELIKLEEIRLNKDQVIELFMNKPSILDFIPGHIYTYNRILAMEYYKYIQLIATLMNKKILLYPLIYDYFDIDLSDLTFYPTIFTGTDRVTEYIDWLRKSKANYLIDFKKWLMDLKKGSRIRTIIKQIIFVFNNISPELISYIDSININRETKITVIAVKKYRSRSGDCFIHIMYYPWRY
ncbi:MAG: hypothetical protein QXU89_01900 [Desulfurococcaceae archaeon]